MKYIFQDFKKNWEAKNWKGIIFMISFRLTSLIRANRFAMLFFFVIPILHVLLFNWLMGFDIPLKTIIGKDFVIFHGHGVVINAKTKIGRNVTIRQHTTIGTIDMVENEGSLAPEIGDNVQIGAHVIILGPIEIGHNSIIGAGTLVLKSVPSGFKVFGNPITLKPINPRF
ncbi:serine acetyltransferase [Reichenbachiella ulvae]|uniref:Serine acetyltransferase n=1 Tax=Reichenbachiella ulvae TaxID=2980104 RepID=A0ABT3CY85_9BACT|nr:serine acetyltransferase [Reichenbachiella ulvae]MCV9388489.1 serine acetyltransferase [Reichenbachiella ulvae]